MEKTTIKFSSLKGNSMLLDGGAMFGNAPKELWKRWVTTDDKNRINIASRCLLAQTASHTILFETGVGAFFDPCLKKRYGVVEADHQLVFSLRELEIEPEDITHVILSHLHFDHAGGLFKQWKEGCSPELLFSNAEVITSQENWKRSMNPHMRDRVSFIPELAPLLQKSGRLSLKTGQEILAFDDLKVRFFVSHGHTPGMLLSDITTPDNRLIFAGDIAPGRHWVNLPITMGYDRYPEKLVDEKQMLLKQADDCQAWLFYTHDPEYAASKLTFDVKKQRYLPCRLIESFRRKSLNDL